jgi:hypothetical protein
VTYQQKKLPPLNRKWIADVVQLLLPLVIDGENRDDVMASRYGKRWKNHIKKQDEPRMHVQRGGDFFLLSGRFGALALRLSMHVKSGPCWRREMRHQLPRAKQKNCPLQAARTPSDKAWAMIRYSGFLLTANLRAQPTPPMQSISANLPEPCRAVS